MPFEGKVNPYILINKGARAARNENKRGPLSPQSIPPRNGKR
ncbi:hypothetical protein DBT_2188 [Dissulfuribacter thermophilus]|uniref:Uncharacterized protein n=1 Tax=Dissulfuribacter thermophilus TaxID=1156395 RepID=A0A1B9F3E6_9BACT|nr:hypothetical protein DBT_2188 [Dissulfuribacter thermophilus]